MVNNAALLTVFIQRLKGDTVAQKGRKVALIALVKSGI